MKIKLFPSIGQMFFAFQLLHIWFKGSSYFNWWWVLPLFTVSIIASYIEDKLEDYIDRKKQDGYKR